MNITSPDPTVRADSGQRTADSPRRTGADRLRYIPPAAALGTAFVLQLVAVADTIGQPLGEKLGIAGHILGILFGLSVACSLEGGAAYLMDLYDKHLLARDSTWLLRLAMVVYVAGSGAGLHWWLAANGLPTLISWLLAGTTASALFLFARGSRWKNRQQMITAGQLDPALPRMPMASKILHPIRWVVTLFLISWEPVSTTSQARARYRTWKDRNAGKESLVNLDAQLAMFLTEGRMTVRRMEAERELSALREQVAAELSAAERMRAEADLYAERTRTAADGHATAVRGEVDVLYAAAVRTRQEADRAKADAQRTADTRPDRAPDRASDSDRRTPALPRQEVSVDQLADSLAKRFPDSVPGRPTALEHLKKVYGSCSNDRARAAMSLLAARREGASA